MSASTREEWLESFGVSGWVHEDGTVCDEYLAPPASTPPGGYWCTTHQMFVRHPASPIILEVSKYDPDVDPQVIADSCQAELIPSSLPRRDRGDEQTGIVIYRWSGNAPNEYDALTLAKTELEKERSG